jgi:hypothetical protein
MIDVKSLKTETLRNLASTIKEELDRREQEEVTQAIDDFQRAFNHLRELRVDIRYSSDGWNDDAVEYLREWDGFSFY